MSAQSKKIDTACFYRFSKFQPTRKWVNKVTQNLFQIRACVLAREKQNILMSQPYANTPLGQSERACYLSYFIDSNFFFLRFVVIFHVIRHVTAFDQWKHPFVRRRGGSAAVKRICSSNWGISKLLAVFISFAVMGWFYLLTKCFIMPSCDEIEAKMASTWLHFLCRIPEV